MKSKYIFVELTSEFESAPHFMGSCQLCGAPVANGMIECLDIYEREVLHFDYTLTEVNESRFFIVDAHALQHPELYGWWNNHLHLARLHLMLTKGVVWQYVKTQKLSDFLKKYRFTNPELRLKPPPAQHRGAITVKTVSEAVGRESYVSSTRSWASSAYQSWGQHHETINSMLGSLII